MPLEVFHLSLHLFKVKQVTSEITLVNVEKFIPIKNIELPPPSFKSLSTSPKLFTSFKVNVSSNSCLAFKINASSYSNVAFEITIRFQLDFQKICLQKNTWSSQ